MTDAPHDSFFPLDSRPHPGPRFEVLLPALSAIEDAISHQSDQRTLRAQAHLRRHGMSEDEMSNELAILHHETQELLSRVLRCGFLVSVWSLFESSINELREYVRAERSLGFGLGDQQGRDFLAQTDAFFRASLNLRAFPNDAEWKQLHLLRKFRNALAHYDGSIAKVPNKLLADGLVHGFCLVGHSHEFAVPSANYTRSSLELIARVGESLAEKVFARLPLRNGAA